MIRFIERVKTAGRIWPVGATTDELDAALVAELVDRRLAVVVDPPAAPASKSDGKPDEGGDVEPGEGGEVTPEELADKTEKDAQQGEAGDTTLGREGAAADDPRKAPGKPPKSGAKTTARNQATAGKRGRGGRSQ